MYSYFTDKSAWYVSFSNQWKFSIILGAPLINKYILLTEFKKGRGSMFDYSNFFLFLRQLCDFFSSSPPFGIKSGSDGAIQGNRGKSSNFKGTYNVSLLPIFI